MTASGGYVTTALITEAFRQGGQVSWGIVATPSSGHADHTVRPAELDIIRRFELGMMRFDLLKGVP